MWPRRPCRTTGGAAWAVKLCTIDGGFWARATTPDPRTWAIRAFVESPSREFGWHRPARVLHDGGDSGSCGCFTTSSYRSTRPTGPAGRKREEPRAARSNPAPACGRDPLPAVPSSGAKTQGVPWATRSGLLLPRRQCDRPARYHEASAAEVVNGLGVRSGRSNQAFITLRTTKPHFATIRVSTTLHSRLA